MFYLNQYIQNNISERKLKIGSILPYYFHIYIFEIQSVVYIYNPS